MSKFDKAPQTTQAPSQEILNRVSELRTKITKEGIDWIRNSKRAEISDKEISGLLHGFGRYIFAKFYFDMIDIPQAEKDLISHPEELIQLREEISRFIADNLSVSIAGFTPEEKEQLVLRKKEYLESLAINNNDYAEWINGSESAVRYKNILYKEDGNFSFSAPGKFAYPSIRFQDSFIHWRSPEYANRRLQGEMPETKYRIYLNPDSKRFVEIFKKIIEQAKSGNMLMSCKFQDRALELGTSYKKQEKEPHIRGDGIVIYLQNEEDLKSMLDFVLNLHQENPDAFNGRETNKIPCPVVPGVAIGSEPTEEDVSLTSHRVNFLEDVANKTLERVTRNGGNEMTVFREVLKEEALKYNINPDNMAFNLKD